MLEEDGRPYMESFKDWEDSDNDEREDGEVDFYDRLNPTISHPIQRLKAEFQWIKGFGKNENYESGGIFFDQMGAETGVLDVSGFRSILNRTMINR